MKRIDLFLEKLEKELELPIFTKWNDFDLLIYAKLKKFNLHLATVRRLTKNNDWKLINYHNNFINDIYENLSINKL